MSFDGIGKTVQRVCGKGQHGHQYRIDRHHVAAKTGAEDGDGAKAELQQQRAQHDVAVKRQQAPHIAAPRLLQHGKRHATQRQHPFRH